MGCTVRQASDRAVWCKRQASDRDIRCLVRQASDRTIRCTVRQASDKTAWCIARQIQASDRGRGYKHLSGLVRRLVKQISDRADWVQGQIGI